MAKYLVLIYGDAQAWADAPEEWHSQNADKHAAFHAEVGRPSSAASSSSRSVRPSAFVPAAAGSLR